ncbi:hypothetical protein tb265_38960 [Gemmatimonadetes bacterium T265]|nr:hypothetical protein tb265_38960 [Gemmatimonadetes bacterium T265]
MAVPKTTLPAPIAATGTTTINRWVVGDEYVRALQDLQQRMRVYTRMRRGDGAVHTSLLAVEKPILGARWTVDGDDAIAEACRAELFDTESGDPWDPPLLELLLQHLLGFLQYGFAAAEPQWTLGDDGRVHCRRLTLIRQESVHTFELNPDGSLRFLKQWTQQLDHGWVELDVPAEGLLLAVHARDGADYSGVALIRAAYRAWLERDTIRKTRVWHHDRFGAGTPVAEYPPNAGDDEKREIDQALEDFRAGARTYLALPSGTKVQIVGGQVTGDVVPELASLAAEIAKVTLSQITELGTSGNSGSRALSASFAYVLRSALQGYAEYLAAVIRRQLLTPFVRWNFGEAATVPTLSVRVSLAGVQELLDAIVLAVEAGVALQPEDIAQLRDEMELPEIAFDELKTRIADAQAKADAAAATSAANPLQGAARDLAKKPPTGTVRRPKVPQPNAAGGAAALADAADAIMLDAPAQPSALATAPDYLGRLRPAHVVALEDAVLKPATVGPLLDREALRAGADAHDVLRAIDRALVDRVRALAADPAALPGKVGSLTAPADLTDRLTAVLTAAAARADALGGETVRAELGRQGLDTTAADATTLADRVAARVRAVLFADPAKYGGLRRLLRALVALYAAREVQQRETAAQQAALAAVVGAASAPDDDPAIVGRIGQAVADVLAARSTAAVDARLSEVINVAFGQGRARTAQLFGQSIDRQVRSEALDGNTCAWCAAHDGDNYAYGDPEAPELPDPACDGGFRCRGVWIFTLTPQAASR